jgi:hypothetical protein
MGQIVDIPKEALVVVRMARMVRHHRNDGSEMVRSDTP